MWLFILGIIKTIITAALRNTILKFLHPHLLKLDAWCERHIGIDLIKQELKFKEKWPNIEKRIQQLENDSHPPISIEQFDGYKDLVKRIEKLEK